MTREERLRAVIGDFYAAALDPRLWAEAIAGLIALIGGWGASLEVHSKRTRELVFFEGTMLPTEEVARYQDHFEALCPRIPRLVRAQAGTVDFDYNFFTERDMDRSEFYTDFLAPVGLRYYLAGSLLNDASHSGVLAIHRTREQGHVNEAEVELFGLALPHVRRALDISVRLGAAERRERDLRETLNRLGVGAVLVDERGRVIFMNRRAEHLMARGSPLSVHGRRVLAERTSERAIFDRLLADALSTAAADALSAGGSMLAQGLGGSPPLSVLVSPLLATPQNLADFMARERGAAAALILVADADRPALISERRLGELFELTPAEARLAAALAYGSSVADYAAQQGISIHTARTHLVHVREKMGAKNQADLIRRLLLALSPGV